MNWGPWNDSGKIRSDQCAGKASEGAGTYSRGKGRAGAVKERVYRRTEFRVLRTTYGLFEGLQSSSEAEKSSYDPQETKPLLKKEENTETTEE